MPATLFCPENDAGLDSEHWTGHTGCVILAPHLIRITKKELGLPHRDVATERQRRDRMCWSDEQERYNNGVAFKMTCRDESGVIVTVIADNYFGYCKKEVKTQISFSANLFGLCEEEHAGGALVFPRYDLGEELSPDPRLRKNEPTFEEVASLYAEQIEIRPQVMVSISGFRTSYIFLRTPALIYTARPCAGNVTALRATSSCCRNKPICGRRATRLSSVKPEGGRAWRLVGTVAEGNPATSRPLFPAEENLKFPSLITDSLIQGPVFVSDFKQDFDRVEELINRSYEGRFRDGRKTLSSWPES